MSYEDAPATRMLATHCAVCRRPLVDAKSVEIGMGPDCRKKYGYDLAVSPEARASANKIVYELALHADATDELPAKIAELKSLGFEKLAMVVAERMAAVKVLHEDGRYLTFTPYNVNFVDRIRTVRGRRWNKESKAWSVPDTEKAALWSVLKSCFDGRYGLADKGLFEIGSGRYVTEPDETERMRGDEDSGDVAY